MQISYIDGPRLQRALTAACAHARSRRAELNRINVFPVPDGDTGTNLALTVSAITDRLRHHEDPTVSGVAGVAAQAAVLGARGNCGMMLSHFMLGFAARLQGHARVDAAGFGDAMVAGVDHLQAALEHPIEGTILTVMRDTAAAAAAATEAPGVQVTRDFVPLIEHLVAAARASLARTPDLLPVLKDAGVVDAGGKGFVTLLEGVRMAVRGEPIGVTGSASAPPGVVPASAVPVGDEQYRFCTEALVRGRALPDQAVVRAHLRTHGDSLIVIRTADVVKVHIHTDHPDRTFAYLRSLGELVTHKAEDMRVQHAAVERAVRTRHVALARRPVVLVTDSAGDLPDEVVRAHGIHVTPLLLVTDDTTVRDGVDITAAEFHRRLEGGPDPLPTTSQPAPADFLETYARAAEEGEQIVAVMLGSALSGTHGSAEAAARRFTDARVHVVDTQGASLLQGLLTLKAAEMAERGTAPVDIVAELRRVRAQSGILFTVDTFDRLIRSGRIGRGRALLGSLIQVKPVLGLTDDGAIELVARAIGRRRVRARLLDAVEARVGSEPTRRVRFGVVHVGCPGIVVPVCEALRARFGEVEVLSAPATPVISTHLGTGAWGVAYLVED